MKRPVALTGFTCWVALIGAQYLPSVVTLAVLGLSLLTAIISLLLLCLRKQKRAVAPLLLSVTVCLSVVLFFGVSAFAYQPVAPLHGKEAAIHAVVLEPPTRSNGRYYYRVKVTHVDLDDAPQGFNLRLSAMQPFEAEMYDEITGRVHFMKPPQSDAFDSLTYYKAQNVYLYAYTLDLDWRVHAPEQKPLLYHLKTLRQTIGNKILQVFPNDEGGLMVGLLLGDRSHIDQNVQEQFRTAGISHILSLSGMHFSIISMMLLQIFSLFRLNRRNSALILIVFSVFYMALVGFGPSIIRSGLMIILYQSSYLFRRRPDSLTSLGFAVLIMCLVSPFSAFDVGFMLSVAGTLGIIVMAPPMAKAIDGKTHGQMPKLVTDNVAVTLSATIFTLPLILLFFGEISTMSIVANVLLALPTTALLILIFLFAILTFIPFAGFISYPIGLLAGLLAKVILAVVRLLSLLPFAVLASSQDYIRIWLLAALLLFGLAFVLGQKKPPLRLAALLSIIVLLAGIFSYQLAVHGSMDVSVLDVGNGTAVVVTAQDHAVVVSCGGDKMAGRDTLNHLKKQGVRRLDAMVLPALDSDTAGGAPEVLRKYEVHSMVSPAEGPLKSRVDHALPDAAVRHASSGSDIRLWGEVRIQSLVGNGGQMTYMTVKEVEFLLITGTLDVEEIPSDWRRPDVLICSGLPENADKLSFQYLFFSVGSVEAQEMAPVLPEGENVLMTGGQGALVMRCFDGREIHLRRGA